MVDEKILKIIEELKVAREQKKISYKEIVARTEANGEGVSIGSVKNVFSKTTKHNHDYQHTILPIIHVLTPERADDIDFELLKTRVDLKDSFIQQKNDEIEELKERLESKSQKHKERERFLIEQIEFYKEQIKIKDEQIKFRDEQIKRYETNIDRKDAMIRKFIEEEKG